MRWLKTTMLGTIALSGIPGSTAAQDLSPMARIQALALDTADVGGIRVHYAPQDRQHALRLAALGEEAASYFNGEFGTAFFPQLAVLRPDHWFVPYPGSEDEPYGIPWGWIPDLLIAVPASLEEGVLITGSDRSADLRRVRFVMLHEFGHLASKQLLHPRSGQPYSSVRWFDELLATYFAYAFVHASDRGWARTAQEEWQREVASFTPPVVSLDWSYFRELSPGEFARTYAWYQNLLNLQAAAIYEQHGLDFLREAGDRLNWQDAANWSTDELLPVLDSISPGFQAWASGLEASDAEAEFLAAKELKDRLYAERDDCPRLMSMFSEDVTFWEKGQLLDYDVLVEYCPHLPRDIWQPEESSSKRVMLGEDAAYEILTEKLVHPEDGSIHVRTTTEIWQRLGDDWKITHMNIGLHPIE